MLPEDVAIKAWTDGGMAAGRRVRWRGRLLRPRLRAVDRTAMENVKVWKCGNMEVWKCENGDPAMP